MPAKTNLIKKYSLSIVCLHLKTGISKITKQPLAKIIASPFRMLVTVIIEPYLFQGRQQIGVKFVLTIYNMSFNNSISNLHFLKYLRIRLFHQSYLEEKVFHILSFLFIIASGLFMFLWLQKGYTENEENAMFSYITKYL